MKKYSMPMLPFPDFPEMVTDTATQHELIEHRKRKEQNMFMLEEVGLIGNNDMPTVNAYTGEIPVRFIASHEARTFKNHNVGVLFYEDDYQFNRLWNNPKSSLDILKQYNCVIGPDFSQYLNMPKPARFWNNYRNKLLMAWMQANGLNVIPNITWSDMDSYSYCFDGLPKHSVISISSLGAKSNPDSTYFWWKGYEEAIKRLEPTTILRYGEMLDGEDTNISIRINNPYTSGLDYGW